MSDIIERVALAMRRERIAILKEHLDDVVNSRVTTEADSDLRVARAAIEAMREPTEEMLKLTRPGGPTVGAGGPGGSTLTISPEDWRAMIDAALGGAASLPHALSAELHKPSSWRLCTLHTKGNEP